MEALTSTSGIESQSVVDAFVILLRNTTWKCGRVERLIINYLRRQLQHGKSQSLIKDIVEHFELKGKQEQQFFEAAERLETRGLIKIVFNPFSPPDSDSIASNKCGGI